MLKRFFIAGLLIWVPLSVTYWVITTVVNALDQILPPHFQPQALFGREIPGFGVLVVVLVVLLTGFFAANLLGRRLVDAWESLLARIPLVRSIYSSVKQVSDTILAPNGQAFRQAVLVQYPRQGAWTIAFVTGSPSQEIATLLSAPSVSIYVPTTPNPTSGFFLMVPKTDVLPLSIGVDAALKYVVSMGTVPPAASVAGRPPSSPKQSLPF
jgi:uncharacterized membrane protein